MIFEITQTANTLQNGEVKSVRVTYQARNEARTVNVSGRFDLDSEKFKENEEIEQLKVLAKEHLEGEISAK